MFKYFFYAALLFVSATALKCNKSTNVTPIPTPAARIFQCKINGVAWEYKNPNTLPFLDNRPRTRWLYDPSYKNGDLEIGALRYFNNDSLSEVLTLNVYGINTNKLIIVDTSENLGFSFTYSYSHEKPMCAIFSTLVGSKLPNNFYQKGSLSISKLDTVTKTLAGRFEFTVFKNGCDTFKITEGLFDLKY